MSIAVGGDYAMRPPDTPRTVVRSSLLASVGYAPDATLDIELRSGALYRFFTVPPAVFRALMAAESKGEYFNHHIRTRFQFQRLD